MDIKLAMNRLVIIKRDQVAYIDLLEIIFIERIRQRTLIHTEQTEVSVATSLKEMLNILPEMFIRSHKSFIVNVYHLRELNFFNRNTYEAYYSNRKTALISKQVVRESINCFKLGGE